MSPELLTRIGEYELKEKLGQGGYGAVYKARDSLGRDVAIKVLTAFGDDTNTIEGFKKEATTLARLNHRNIVTVYQFGVDNGKPYLAMEYLQGQPLSAIIKSRREMHLVEKLDIIIQASEGLRHAHENKVIHRDIKPHNLMVVENSIVKLIDFGIAQGDGSKSQSRQEIAGSLPYMSPEHFVQRRTPWCDIFSMGVVLYELLTGGNVPYASDRDDLPVAYHKLMSNEPAPPLSTYVQDLPPGLEEVVAKAISKQKLNGYETAEEFVFELARIQETVKADFVNQLLAAATEAVNRQDFKVAHDLVERILRVDPNNVAAKRRQFELRKYVQQFQRNEQLHAICVRVEEAIQSKKFDLAQLGLEEAKQIDPASNTVAMLQQKLVEFRQLQAKIEGLIADAQRYGMAGNWQPAEQAVDEALQIEASNTRALEFRDAIRRAVAQETRIVEQARAALDDLKFREAFELIRQAEAIAPNSERVNALKELAVNVYKENERRREITAATQSAKDLAAQGNYAGAREQLDQAIAKYSDERSLLDLRADVEKQQEETARRQFVDEKLHAAEEALDAKNYIGAIAILEPAIRRVPDPGLQSLLEKAKQKAQKQAVEKRREQYVKSAKDSLGRGDSASAVVTLEMAQSEFGAADQEIQRLLEEARAAAERDAKAAAEREKKERREAEQRAREAAQKQEIQTSIANARAQSEQGDFTGALKLIEQCASKHGMRAELSNAANEIKAARTANAASQIETLIAHASEEASSLHFPGALQAIERAKSFTEFASQTIVIKLKTAEKKILEAAQEQQNAATQVMKIPAAAAATSVVQDPESLQATKLFGGGASAAAAAAPAPIRRPEPAQQPTTAERRVTSAPRQVPQPPPPAPSKKWIPLVAVAVLAVVAVSLYFVFSPSGVQVSFDADPAGTVITVDGQQCQAPCALKMKAGKHSLKATHDQYASLEKEITVEKPYTESLKLTAVSSGPSAIATAFGTLALSINVPGADIFVDGQYKDTAKGSKTKLQVSVGHHEIKVDKQAYQAATQPVDIAKDGEAALSFTLEKGSSTEAAQTFVIIKSVPNAKVVIDNQPVGTVQADGKYSGEIEPGKQHAVQLTLDGYEPATKTFTAQAGQKLSLNLSLKGLKASVLSFTADNMDIQAGKYATLSWDTQGATEVSIDGLGTLPAKGTKQVSPNATTTYNLIASGPGGKSSPQRLTIKVAAAAAAPAAIAKPMIARFELGTDSIREGEKAKLFWDAQNADSVTIDPDLGQQKPSGSISVSPTKTTTYTLIAKGPGGTATSQVQTLTVEAKAQPAASAPPAAASTPTSTGPDDNQLIKQLLEQRWKAAFESGNPSEAKDIWPSIPKAIQDGIKQGHGQIKIDLKCNPSVSGDKATARCDESVVVNGKPMPATVTFNLSKAAGNWLIQSSK